MSWEDNLKLEQRKSDFWARRGIGNGAAAAISDPAADAARVRAYRVPTASEGAGGSDARYLADDSVRSIVAEGRPSEAAARKLWYGRLALAVGNAKSKATGQSWYCDAGDLERVLEASFREGVQAERSAVADFEKEDAELLKAAGLTPTDLRELREAGCSHADIIKGARIFARGL